MKFSKIQNSYLTFKNALFHISHFFRTVSREPLRKRIAQYRKNSRREGCN
jgi:hypothetical protein